MDNSLHAFVAAQYTQDRMAHATDARLAREARRATVREPKLRHARRWLTRRTDVVPTPEPSRTITVLPPL